MGLHLGNLSLRQWKLVANSIQFLRPLCKRRECFAVQKLLHRNLPLRDWRGDFVVDQVVVEINPLRVLAGVAVINFLEARPVDRGQTHRARLATGVEFAIVEMEIFQPLAGVTDGHHLCVRRGIVGGSDLIPAAPDDLSFADDHSAERPAVIAAHLDPREPDCFVHVFILHKKSEAGFSVLDKNFPDGKLRVSVPCDHLLRRYNAAN